MTTPRPDDLPPEMLAAYADGELSPRERARVEDWLAEHPEAAELLDAQESIGPGNVEMWQSVQPPTPSEAQWAEAYHGIESRAPFPARPSRTGWIGSLGLLAMAATVVFLVSTGDPPERPVAPEVARPVKASAGESDEPPYAMAQADDVRILSLPEAAATLLLVGEHPLGNSLLTLARADEIEFHGVGSDLAGRFPEVPSDPSSTDAPMIWTPRAP
jgi:anti-sigma factor RsiW